MRAAMPQSQILSAACILPYPLPNRCFRLIFADLNAVRFPQLRAPLVNQRLKRFISRFKRFTFCCDFNHILSCLTQPPSFVTCQETS